MNLTQELLKQSLDYNPDTGIFNRKINGRVAGTICKRSGYVSISVYNKRYYAHRLAWLYTNCVWPIEQIDHINGIRNDNRISNLREATKNENQRNKKIQTNNSSGYKGVYFDTNRNRWRACIRVNNKLIHLGSYIKLIDAAIAYQTASISYHGDFASD